ncbi:hypothetical protein ABBQ32_007787 [Trebouxia sp. C0010 RCD-2024]
MTEKTWRKHSTASWAAPAVLWEASSQKEWKRIYISMLVNWRIRQKAVISFLTGHTLPVTCLTASQGTIASGSADKTVRVWDRKTHICRHILQLPSSPSALYLLSDDVTAVTCLRSCSVWKGSRCLRTICPNLLGRSHICCTTVSENLLFLAAHGESTIHVWDLYSGLELQIFRPTDSAPITSLAAGTLHGQQVLLAGTENSLMLVLRQDDGQALAPPVRIDFRRPVKRIILQEDEFAVAAGSLPGNSGWGAPTIVRFCKAQEQRNPGRPSLTASSFSLRNPEHPLALTRIQGTLILLAVQKYDHTYKLAIHPVTQSTLNFGHGDCTYESWMKSFPDTRTFQPSLHGSGTFVDKSVVVEHSCGLLATSASNSRVAVWQFPFCPESEV